MDYPRPATQPFSGYLNDDGSYSNQSTANPPMMPTSELAYQSEPQNGLVAPGSAPTDWDLSSHLNNLQPSNTLGLEFAPNYPDQSSWRAGDSQNIHGSPLGLDVSGVSGHVTTTPTPVAEGTAPSFGLLANSSASHIATASMFSAPQRGATASSSPNVVLQPVERFTEYSPFLPEQKYWELAGTVRPIGSMDELHAFMAQFRRPLHLVSALPDHDRIAPSFGFLASDSSSSTSQLLAVGAGENDPVPSTSALEMTPTLHPSSTLNPLAWDHSFPYPGVVEPGSLSYAPQPLGFEAGGNVPAPATFVLEPTPSPGPIPAELPSAHSQPSTFNFSPASTSSSMTPRSRLSVSTALTTPDLGPSPDLSVGSLATVSRKGKRKAADIDINVQPNVAYDAVNLQSWFALTLINGTTKPGKALRAALAGKVPDAHHCVVCQDHRSGDRQLPRHLEYDHCTAWRSQLEAGTLEGLALVCAVNLLHFLLPRMKDAKVVGKANFYSQVSASAQQLVAKFVKVFPTTGDATAYDSPPTLHLDEWSGLRAVLQCWLEFIRSTVTCTFSGCNAVLKRADLVAGHYKGITTHGLSPAQALTLKNHTVSGSFSSGATSVCKESQTKDGSKALGLTVTVQDAEDGPEPVLHDQQSSKKRKLNALGLGEGSSKAAKYPRQDEL